MSKEEELIKGCIKNDRICQRRLYDRFAGRMLVICLRYTKNQLEAEDILQESFIKIFENIQKFRNECPLEQWIKRIIINTALKNNRGKMYLYPAVDIDYLEDDLFENQTLSNYNYKELLELIRKLPTRYQIVFNLYAIEGYQHKEIAEMLSMQEGTSKSLFSRARVMLQKIVRDHYEIENDEKSKILKITNSDEMEYIKDSITATVKRIKE